MANSIKHITKNAQTTKVGDSMTICHIVSTKSAIVIRNKKMIDKTFIVFNFNYSLQYNTKNLPKMKKVAPKSDFFF